jgi:hypothetical protein
MIILPNYRGIAILLFGFGIACALDEWLGLGDVLRNIVVGLLVIASDLTYRLNSKNGLLFEHDGGGSFLFVPMWCLGIAWIILSIVIAVRDQIRNMLLQFIA